MTTLPPDLGTNLMSPQPDIVLGSEPPSPTTSEHPQLTTTTTTLPPPTPPIPTTSTHPTPATSSPPTSSLAHSLHSLASEPAFLPSSSSIITAAPPLARSHSSGLYSGQGLNPQLTAADDDDDEPLAQAAPPPPAPAKQVHNANEETELYIPGLMSSSLFVLLPMTDSLTPIVEKYLAPHQRPTRHLTGNWKGQTLNQLITTQSWRAVAEYCHDAIMNSSADQTSFLLSHWLLRLHSILRLHLLEHLFTELTGLFSLLPPSSYPSPSSSSSSEIPLFHPSIPFEFHVLLASLPGLRGDGPRSVESLTDVLRGSKSEMWKCGKEGDLEGERKWRERAERVGGLVVGVLKEIRAAPSASSLLNSGEPSLYLLRALCRLHHSTGDLESFSTASSSLVNLDGKEDRAARKAIALGNVARGEWTEAEKGFRELLLEDKEDAETLNNLAVTLLFQSKLPESITLLTSLLSSRSSNAYSSEVILFNLATLYELRTVNALQHKIELLRSVVERGGESVRGGCLKLMV